MTSYPQMYKPFHTWSPLHVLVNFMKKEPSIKFNGVLDHFLGIYEVTKF